MTTKTWVKVKRGLLIDPKHRLALGNRIWLYLYILDRADWDTGKVLEWRDEEEASQMQMPVGTLRKWRREIEDQGYISCLQKVTYQEITIKNWINPREYSGKVYNKDNKGGQKETPSKKEGDTEGGTEGGTEGAKKVTPLPYNSQITDHRSQEKSAPDKFETIQNLLEGLLGVSPSTAADIKAINEMIELKAKDTDIKAAVKWLKEHTDKPIRYYSSLIGPVKVAVAGRVQKDNKFEPAMTMPAGYRGV